MNIIKTIAPIPFEELKKYFEDDTITFEIDVEKSELKNEKLITYISNLDIPIKLTTKDEQISLDLLESYLKSSSIVSLKELEILALDILLLNKHTSSEEIKDTVSDVAYNFILRNKEILDLYYERANSLILYNMKTTGLYEDWINELPIASDEVKIGLNFVSLLKYRDFYSLIDEKSEPLNNPTMFNEYIFKGKNLYHYWTNKNNPIFLFQEAILSGKITYEEYAGIVDNENIEK